MHIRDYIEDLRSRPEHIRRRIALGSSFGITALVGAGWLVALTSSGVLALSSPAQAPETRDLTTAVEKTQSSFSDLLGAASAFQGISDAVAPLTIVDARASSTLDQPTDAMEGKTVIPF